MVNDIRRQYSVPDFGKIPPQDIATEEVVLGQCCLIGNINQAKEILSSEVFYKEAHQIIYQAMLELDKGKKPIELITVTQQLKRMNKVEEVGGAYGLTQIVGKAVFGSSITHNCQILYELWVKRELIRISMEIASKAYEDPTDCFQLIEQVKLQIKDIEPRGGGGFSAPQVKKDVDSYFDLVKQGKMVGIPTGMRGFDEHTGGLNNSDLIIIGSFSSNGKTATALNILTNAGALGYKGKVYTFEQSLIQLYMRQMSILSKVASKDMVIRGMHSHPDVQSASKEVAKHNTLYTNRCVHINDFCNDIRRCVETQGIQYAILDYIQLMRSNHTKRYDSVSYIGNTLKEMANELNIPIIAISQLKRPEAGKKIRPLMSMLKESGDLENAADIVWLPWIPYNEPTEARDVINDWNGTELATMVNGEKLMLHSIAKGRNYGTTHWKSYITDYYKINQSDPEIIFRNQENAPF
jgi:replicative DNA helicase